MNLFGGFATGSGSVSVVEVACNVEMSTGGDGAGNRGNGVKERFCGWRSGSHF